MDTRGVGDSESCLSGCCAAGFAGKYTNIGRRSGSQRNDMKAYAIHWKSSVTGTAGTGTKRFEKEEAERLASELNESYPEIAHEAVIPAPAAADPVAAEPVSSPSD